LSEIVVFPYKNRKNFEFLGVTVRNQQIKEAKQAHFNQITKEAYAEK
jgi:hypothetical protein